MIIIKGNSNIMDMEDIINSYKNTAITIAEELNGSSIPGGTMFNDYERLMLKIERTKIMCKIAELELILKEKENGKV